MSDHPEPLPELDPERILADWPVIIDAKFIEDNTLPHPNAAPEEAALSRRKLEYLRKTGQGPTCLYVGKRRIKYLRDDFVDWLVKLRRTTMPTRVLASQSEDGRTAV